MDHADRDLEAHEEEIADFAWAKYRADLVLFGGPEMLDLYAGDRDAFFRGLGVEGRRESARRWRERAFLQAGHRRAR